MNNDHDRAARLEAIAQRLGFTLWQLQVLEQTAARVFVLLTDLVPRIDKQVAVALLEKAEAKTFGTNVRAMAKAQLLAPTLQSRLERLLDERNWLVHRSRSSNRGAVESADAATKLIERIDAIASESLGVIGELTTLAESYVKNYGITDAQIEAAASRLLDEWENADAD